MQPAFPWVISTTGWILFSVHHLIMEELSFRWKGKINIVVRRSEYILSLKTILFHKNVYYYAGVVNKKQKHKQVLGCCYCTVFKQRNLQRDNNTFRNSLSEGETTDSVSGWVIRNKLSRRSSNFVDGLDISSLRSWSKGSSIPSKSSEISMSFNCHVNQCKQGRKKISKVG